MIQTLYTLEKIFQNQDNPSRYGRIERILCKLTICTTHTHFPPGCVIVACMFMSLPAFLSTTWTPAGPNVWPLLRTWQNEEKPEYKWIKITRRAEVECFYEGRISVRWNKQRQKSLTFPFTENPVNTKLISPPFVQMSLMPSTWMSTLVGSGGEEQWNSTVVSEKAITKQFYFSFTKLSQKCINSSTKVLLWKSCLSKVKAPTNPDVQNPLSPTHCSHFCQNPTFLQISSCVTLSVSTV